ncbi:MAG: isopentenyl-diphosphate Delta-isomerase [Dermatophilaceae bacterium]
MDLTDHERDGYRRCQAITRRHGTTYYWGARLLVPTDRRHVYALYALARLADDIVDLPGRRGPSEVATGLQEFEDQFWTSLTSEQVSDPVLVAIARTVRDCGLDHDVFHRFFAAMRTDLVRSHYDSWADLLGYMDGSAAVIGEMMLPVLHPMQGAREPAQCLGLAFQLTNFLRDVVEDLERGRVYLPADELAHYGVDLSERRVTPQWRDFMSFQIARNRRLYRQADEGLLLLPARSRRCVTTARILYARILDLIEDADYDVFSGRLAVPTRVKAGTAARMILRRRPESAARVDRAARAARSARDDRADGDPDGWRDDSEVVLLTDDGHACGTAAKSVAHHDDTPLHLAFSCYVLDNEGRLLITQRAAAKRSFPGVVTNSLCGHPKPGEPLPDAIRRRARDELGIELTELRLVLPRFRYRALMDGIVENELCPVFTARTSTPKPRPDPAEVQDFSWVSWERFHREASAGDIASLSPWCRAQIPELSRLGDEPGLWPAADPAHLPPAAIMSATVGLAAMTEPVAGSPVSASRRSDNREPAARGTTWPDRTAPSPTTHE